MPERKLTVGAAQMGPISESDDRATVVKRLIDHLKHARDRSCDLVVFPELTLTTFFPRNFYQDDAELEKYFEPSLPSPSTQALFDTAIDLGIGFYLGYAEKIEENGESHYFNSAVLVDKKGTIVQKYRKIHLPGHADHRPQFSVQHLEKRYFAFQRTFHPDRFATKSSREKQLSLQHATDLNEAYDRLKAPLSRAEALLETKGAGVDDHARTESDPELLMEAMESREALADAETADEVAKLEALTRADIELSEEALSLAFSADDLEGATGIVTRLKYLLKLLQEIRRKRLVLNN